MSTEYKINEQYLCKSGDLLLARRSEDASPSGKKENSCATKKNSCAEKKIGCAGNYQRLRRKKK